MKFIFDEWFGNELLPTGEINRILLKAAASVWGFRLITTYE